MKYKYLALDLDGTLLTDEKCISPMTREVLLEAQSKGLKLILASGRPTEGMAGLAQELRLAEFGGYLLSYNGALLSEARGGRVLYERQFPLDALPVLKSKVDELSKYKSKVHEKSEHTLKVEEITRPKSKADEGADSFALIISKDGQDVSSDATNMYSVMHAKANGLELVCPENYIEYVKAPVHKCLIVGEPDSLTVLEEELKVDFARLLDVYKSAPYYLECVAKGVDKAFALGKLLELNGAQRNDLMAMGDSFNDVSMLKFAGFSVAMKNAPDAVKAAADALGDSNNEDGVGKAVRMFISGEIS